LSLFCLELERSVWRRFYSDGLSRFGRADIRKTIVPVFFWEEMLCRECAKFVAEVLGFPQKIVEPSDGNPNR
jgi:hypothetical protein